ncbi:uncharacterized protein LOC143759233 isoform X2 [Ranitomeya variabilis]|uniref:uncharacterized protein LOC143759233 isoform X2 n=1 Tax=Ranitomeya variabilis TaxID=490064 RepID=UPI0040568CCE
MMDLEELEVPEETLLVSLDVESLYTNIAHDQGVQAAAFFLERHQENGEHNLFLLELLHFVLDKNYFTFDRKYYRQITGTAMGARCAPSYANLFLGWWEELVVYQHVMFSSKIAIWRRYIDDVLFLWTGTLEECKKFVADLNTNSLNIHLTSTISESTVDFLDIKLTIKENRVSSCLYRKKTATNNLLHYSSFHPTHLKNGIPKDNIPKKSYQEPSKKLNKRIDKVSSLNRSRNLVYAILCDCPKLYVGQTSQELRKRCQQHLSNISLAKRDREKGKTLTSVAAHFLEAHGSNIRGLKIMGLEGINETIRGGNLTNQLLRCESKWIYKLRSLSPVGLNEELLFTGYYKQL